MRIAILLILGLLIIGCDKTIHEVRAPALNRSFTLSPGRPVTLSTASGL